MTPYEEAAQAIAKGEAEGHALWVLISNESDRDGYWLKPMPWEGPGGYQYVHFNDGRDGFIRIPSSRQSLPTNWGKAKPTIEKRVAEESGPQLADEAVQAVRQAMDDNPDMAF